MRGSWLAGALALVVSGGVGTAVASATPAQQASARIAPAGPAPTLPKVKGVPVLGQFVTRSNDGPAESLVVTTLHAVQRVPNGTVVYFSIGAPKGAQGVNQMMLVSATGDVPNVTFPSAPSFRNGPVGIVDATNKQVLFTYGKGSNCLGCAWIPRDTAKAGEAYVLAMTTPAVPKDVSKVTVRVGSALFVDIPVADGVLTPTVGDTRVAPVVGTNWPKIDVQEFASLKAADFSAPLTDAIIQGEVVTRADDTTTNLDLNASVLFDVDQAVVKSAGEAAITEAVARIKAEKKETATLVVTGHTDSDGSDEHNLDLSTRRAEAVAALLRAQLPQATISAVGKGETEPIASNDTDDGKQANRRVTITLGGK